MQNLLPSELDKEILQQYRIILEEWIPKHASIAIAVDDMYIYFGSGSHDVKLEVGSPIREDSIAYSVLKNRSKTDAVMDNSLFSTPYYAIGYPIFYKEQPAALIIVLPPTFTKPKLETYRFLTGKSGEDWTPVPIDQISHIESLQKHTWFYENNLQYKTSVTLKELETRLPENFIRIHRSYIINIHFIKRITRDITSNFIIILKNQTELPVSQSYVGHVRKVLEF